MKETFYEFINYLKNPVLEKDSNTTLNHRLKVLVHIFLFCAIFASIITPLFTLLEDLGWIDLDTHKVEEVFKDLPFYAVILVGGILIPFIEELMFRAPIVLFKKPKSFKIAFYFFAIVFGLIHITNFEITSTVLLLTPILVLPQLFAGFALGFLRIRFGLRWSVFLHCIYNIFFLSIALIFDS